MPSRSGGNALSMDAQEEGKPLKAAKATKVKRPSTAYALFVKEKYSSISDTLPANERSVALVRRPTSQIGIQPHALRGAQDLQLRQPHNATVCMLCCGGCCLD